MLSLYALGCTLLVAVLLVSKATSERRAQFGEIDVQRINIRKPDGSLSLVLSNEALMPGVIGQGHEYEGRKGVSGLLFFDGEGSEMGGLTFGSVRDGATLSHLGHLSFDGHQQDQTLVLAYSETWEDGERTQRGGGLRLVDREPVPETEYRTQGQKLKSDDPDERAEAEQWFSENYRYGQEWSNRVVVGSVDGTAYIGLNDAQARERLRLSVDEAGAAQVDVLDEAGQVVQTITP